MPKLRQSEKLLEIRKADYLSGYRLRLVFNDEAIRVVDFEPFLRHARNPLIREYLDLSLFKDFSIVYGDLIWHDYALCFPISDLYEGNLEHFDRSDDEDEIIIHATHSVAMPVPA